MNRMFVACVAPYHRQAFPQCPISIGEAKQIIVTMTIPGGGCVVVFHFLLDINFGKGQCARNAGICLFGAFAEINRILVEIRVCNNAVRSNA